MTDVEQITADWVAPGFSCEQWTDPPGQRWEDLTHGTGEVGILTFVGLLVQHALAMALVRPLVNNQPSVSVATIRSNPGESLLTVSRHRKGRILRQLKRAAGGESRARLSDRTKRA